VGGRVVEREKEREGKREIQEDGGTVGGMMEERESDKERVCETERGRKEEREGGRKRERE